MIQYLSKAISSAAISYGIVAEEDRELYEYSFLIMLEQVSIGLSIVLIALIFGVFFETVLYLVLFIPLRIYAGGYHAKTFSGCYIISVGMYLVYVILIKNIDISNKFMLISVLISYAIILLLAPVANPNKAMDIKEKKRFQTLVHRLLVVESVAVAISFWANYATIISFVSFVFFHLAFLLLVGYFYFWKNRQTQDNWQ